MASTSGTTGRIPESSNHPSGRDAEATTVRIVAVVPIPEDVRELFTAAEAAPARYEAVRAAAEARVVEWRWTTGFVPDPHRPYAAELSGLRPGRLVRARPRTGDPTKVGLDVAGCPVVDVHMWQHTGEIHQENYRPSDEEGVGYAIETALVSGRGKPYDVGVQRVTRDGDGRVQRAAAADQGGNWFTEDYTYGSHGKPTAIERNSNIEATRILVEHRADGTLDRLTVEAADGKRWPIYARLDTPVGEVLAELEDDILEALNGLLAGPHSEPLWAVALVYTEEDPLPPTLVTCSRLERDSWTPGGDGDWWLTNPAEWDDMGAQSLTLAEALVERCTLVNAALVARNLQSKGVALLHAVARRCNDGELLVFAREARGERERRDLKRSLPPERFEALRALGAI